MLPRLSLQYFSTVYYCDASWGPYHKHRSTLIPAWMSNYIHYEMWDEITNPFQTSTAALLRFSTPVLLQFGNG